MKRVIALAMALLMVFGLVACGAEEAETPATPANSLAAAFKTAVGEAPDATTEEIAAKLIDQKLVPLDLVSMPVEPGYLNGFAEEIGGFEEGTMFGPMIGAIPMIGYVFRTNSEAEAADLAKTLLDKSDLRWNVCTQADEKACETEGTLVFFTMCPATFEE